VSAPPGVAALWHSRWKPSSVSLRNYGHVVDAAVRDVSFVRDVAAPDLEIARANLLCFVEWLDAEIVDRRWAKRKSLRLSGELGLLTLGAVSLFGGPFTWIGAIAAGGSLAFFSYDVADLGFKSSIQKRIRDLLAKIDLLERAIRQELESRP